MSEPGPVTHPHRGGGRTLLRAVRRLAPHRWYVLLSLLLAVAAVTTSITGPLILRQIIDSALPQRRAGQLGFLCGAMVVAGILSSLAFVAQGALVNLIGQRVVHRLRVDIYARVQDMGLGFFSSVPNTDIQARIVSDVGAISDVITFSAQGFLSAVVTLGAAIVAMLFLNWPMALVVLFLGWVLNLVNNRFALRRRVLSNDHQERVADMLQRVGEDLSLGGVILGRTLHVSRKQAEGFAALSGEVSELVYRQRLAGRTATGLAAAAFTCLPPVIYLLSGTVLAGLSVGTTVVIVLLQAYITGPIGQLMQLSGSVSESLVVFDRIFAYLDMETETPPGAGTSSTLPEAVGDIRVSGLSYTYQGEASGGLHMVDLDLPEGSTTVVVGESGSGKSTRGLLLAGLLRPDAGSIRNAAGRAMPARTACLVPQEATMFNASIAENLRIGCPAATEGQLFEVLDVVRLGETVARLPLGLDTQVGERGYQLSGGERQRVALARALLSPSPLLILDEATSAVDGSSAQILHENIRAYCGKRTLVIVAHRIPRLLPSDRIVVLRHGKVVETGQHAALYASEGEYSRMLSAQAAVTDTTVAPQPVPR